MTSNVVGQTTYELNDWNALWKITNPNSLVTEYAYNQYTGNLSRVNNANNTYTDYDFDNLDRPVSLANQRTGGTVSSFGYQYNDSNLIETITATADHGAKPNGVLKELTVNALNQVTALYMNGQQAATFSYDFKQTSMRRPNISKRPHTTTITRTGWSACPRRAAKPGHIPMMPWGTG